MSITAPCHPERSEGSLILVHQGSLAALGMTTCMHGTARARTRSRLSYLFPYLKALPRGNRPSPSPSPPHMNGEGKGLSFTGRLLDEGVRARLGVPLLSRYFSGYL